MIRQVITLEPENSEEFEECIAFHTARNDGGRTVINLTADKYHLNRPLEFGLTTKGLTINMNNAELLGGGYIKG